MSDRTELEELERNHRLRTLREWALIAAILVIGLILALVVRHEITSADDAVQSIRCEEGDVTLVIERDGGITETVECPAGAEVKP